MQLLKLAQLGTTRAPRRLRAHQMTSRCALTGKSLGGNGRAAVDQHFSAAPALFKRRMTWFGWELRWRGNPGRRPVPRALSANAGLGCPAARQTMRQHAACGS